MKGFFKRKDMEFTKNGENLIDKKVLDELSKKFNLNEKVIEILVNRGYSNEKLIDEFLNSDISCLKDPFLLQNMEKVVERIISAINSNEKVLIFGDYDTDGICATSILYNYLKTKSDNIFAYLPNRTEDGYGLSCPCIDKIAKRLMPNLIITVDCGISCEKEVEYVKKLGIDIIVTDHHELPEKLPNCLILNTKFDQPFNFKGLCGAGVAFKVVQALGQKLGDNVEKYLPMCALATIADIVPLTNENRILVKEGLKRIDLLPLGVKILLKKTLKTLKDVSSTDIAYKIAPKLNSAGRLADANIALKLFLTTNLSEINNCIETIEYLNEKRKKLCEKIFDEAVERIGTSAKNKKIIVLANDSWDIGVLGIVCAKLCEEFSRPIILFGKCQGELKGSCRSLGNVDVVRIFTNAKDLLINFGGHSKAGGLSIEEKNLKAFEMECEKFVAKTYSEEDFLCKKTYDLELKNDEVNIDFVKSLNVLEPCGYENMSPIFKIEINIENVKKMKNNQSHLILGSKNFELISFNDEKNYENYQNFNKITVLTDLQVNLFNGKESLRGIVKAVNFDEPKPKLIEKLEASFFNQLSFCNENTEQKFSVKTFSKLEDLDKILDNSTIILTYDALDDKLKKYNSFNVSSFVLNTKNEKTVLFGIKSFQNIANFDKIILLQKSISAEFLLFLNRLGLKVYEPQEFNFLQNFSLKKEDLLKVYFALVSAIGRQVCADSYYKYFEKMKKLGKADIDFKLFYVSILIFKELSLIELIKNDKNEIKFLLNKKKTDLTKSVIYNKINSLRGKND